jgi:hypothetical protein
VCRIGTKEVKTLPSIPDALDLLLVRSILFKGIDLVSNLQVDYILVNKMVICRGFCDGRETRTRKAGVSACWSEWVYRVAVDDEGEWFPDALSWACIWKGSCGIRHWGGRRRRRRRRGCVYVWQMKKRYK